MYRGAERYREVQRYRGVERYRGTEIERQRGREVCAQVSCWDGNKTHAGFRKLSLQRQLHILIIPTGLQASSNLQTFFFSQIQLGCCEEQIRTGTFVLDWNDGQFFVAMEW